MSNPEQKKTPNYAFPVAADPGTVHFLTLPMEKRRTLGYAPSCITDADRVVAAAALAQRNEAKPS